MKGQTAPASLESNRQTTVSRLLHILCHNATLTSRLQERVFSPSILSTIYVNRRDSITGPSILCRERKREKRGIGWVLPMATCLAKQVLRQLILPRKTHCHHIIPQRRTGTSRGEVSDRAYTLSGGVGIQTQVLPQNGTAYKPNYTASHCSRGFIPQHHPSWWSTSLWRRNSTFTGKEIDSLERWKNLSEMTGNRHHFFVSNYVDRKWAFDDLLMIIFANSVYSK